MGDPEMEPISRDEALELLAREPVAHLGVSIGNVAYVTPMSFVLDGDRLLMRTMAGKKLEGIKANPAVCVEVSSFDEETGDWLSVIVEGTAEFVEDADRRQETIALLFDKYERVMGSPLSGGANRVPLGHPYVIEVPIERISGMSSGRGVNVRTRPGRM